MTRVVITIPAEAQAPSPKKELEINLIGGESSESKTLKQPERPSRSSRPEGPARAQHAHTPEVCYRVMVDVRSRMTCERSGYRATSHKSWGPWAVVTTATRAQTPPYATALRDNIQDGGPTHLL